MDERKIEMRKEAAHSAQLVFLNAGNLDPTTPLSFAVDGQRFRIN